jgi:hypothetical protein
VSQLPGGAYRDSELTSLDNEEHEMVSGTRVQVPKAHCVFVRGLTVTVEKAIESVKDFSILLEG